MFITYNPFEKTLMVTGPTGNHPFYSPVYDPSYPPGYGPYLANQTVSPSVPQNTPAGIAGTNPHVIQFYGNVVEALQTACSISSVLHQYASYFSPQAYPNLPDQGRAVNAVFALIDGIDCNVRLTHMLLVDDVIPDDIHTLGHKLGEELGLKVHLFVRRQTDLRRYITIIPGEHTDAFPRKTFGAVAEPNGSGPFRRQPDQ